MAEIWISGSGKDRRKKRKPFWSSNICHLLVHMRLVGAIVCERAFLFGK